MLQVCDLQEQSKPKGNPASLRCLTQGKSPHSSWGRRERQKGSMTPKAMHGP